MREAPQRLRVEPPVGERNLTIIQHLEEMKREQEDLAARLQVSGAKTRAKERSIALEAAINALAMSWAERQANASLIVTAVNAFHGWDGDLFKVREGDFGEALRIIELLLSADPDMPTYQSDADEAEAFLSRLTEGGGDAK